MEGPYVDSVVLIKQVADTATRIQDRVRQGAIDLEGVTWVVNPYDEYAVEEALRQREKLGGTVTLVALGPERVTTALKDMLALGADEAIHVWDDAFAALGARGRGAVLAAAIRKLPFDVVWAGWKGVDDDEGLVPAYVAHALGIPLVSFVVEAELANGRAKVRREIEGGHDVLDVALPALLTAQKGLNEPRYASLKGIMAVKRKEIPTWDAAALGVDAAGLPGRDTQMVGVEAPPARAAGRILSGNPEEAATELVRLLHDEAKVL
jgi:electron transfer flavoprotein beta subunit